MLLADSSRLGSSGKHVLATEQCSPRTRRYRGFSRSGRNTRRASSPRPIVMVIHVASDMSRAAVRFLLASITIIKLTKSSKLRVSSIVPSCEANRSLSSALILLSALVTDTHEQHQKHKSLPHCLGHHHPSTDPQDISSC